MEKDLTPLEILKSQLWQLVDVLRTEQISSDDYHIILFLMTLHRENLLDVLNKEEPWDKKHELIDSIEGNLLEHNETLEEIYDNTYKVILERIDILGFAKLLERLTLVEKPLFDKFFPELFEDILWRLSKIQGRFSGEYYVSEEVNRFASSLIEIPLNAKVYNPFAGLGTFSFFLPSHVKYYGQEISYKIWAQATLRILAHNKWGSSDLRLGDSINKWNPFMDINHPDFKGFYLDHPKLKFDLIISNPPFGLKINVPVTGLFGSIKFSENLVIEKGLESLNPNGKLICLVRQGFLSDVANKKLNRYLVEEDLLETIISFPGGLLLNTGIPFSIIVLNMNKPEKGIVRMVNAHDFIETRSRTEKILNDSALIAELQKDGYSSAFVKISNRDIQENDFNLSALRYFNEQYTGVPISEFGKIIPGLRLKEQGIGKFIRIRDLKDDVIDFSLMTDVIENVVLPDYSRKIEESCLLIATNWKNHKPTYFHYSDTPIFLSKDIVAIKIDQKVVDIAYLMNELHSSNVIDQIDSYRIGVTVPTIRLEDLLRVRIVLPSIEEQQEKVHLAQLQRINKLQADREILVDNFSKKQYNEFASLKHTLGTPRQNILSYAEALIGFMTKSQSSELDKVNSTFKEKMGIDMLTAFKAIRNDINFISELLEKGENGLTLKNYELLTVPLQDVLEQVKQLCNNHNYNFISIPPSEIHDLAKKDADSLGIRMNFSLLKVLFDNIFSNAHKYAFEKKPFSAAQTVIVELGISEEGFYINILNNGKPFPRNMDKEKFISKYKTSDSVNGTGLGGYDINRIAEYFESEWFLRLNNDPLFPVQFSFWFKPLPIK